MFFFLVHLWVIIQLFLLLSFPTLFCRNKSARTITYSQFKEALSELARKRFKDKASEEAAEEVFKMIEGKSPIIAGVTVIVATEQKYQMTEHPLGTNLYNNLKHDMGYA